jgi:uncharacterized integral membrane protein
VPRKLTLGLIVIPLAVVLTALAVINRGPVILYLNPLGGAGATPAIEAPLFVLLLGACALGVIIGGVATWLSQGKWRRNARETRAEAKALRRQADRLEKELEGDPGRGVSERAQLPAR